MHNIAGVIGGIGDRWSQQSVHSLVMKEFARSPDRAAHTPGSSTPIGSRKRKSHVPERIPLSLNGEQVTSQSEKCQGLPQLPHSSKRPHLMEQTQLPTADAKSYFLPFGFPCGVLGVISNNFNFGCQAETALDLSLKTKKRPAEESAVPQQPKPILSEEPLEQQQQMRQNFSSSQNDHLLRWFLQHRDRPYPGAEDTKALALATGLTYSQVKKWFANKRMRSKGSLESELGGASADSLSPVTNSNASSSQASSARLSTIANELP
ncbi:hypothetical protein BOX15_Mlig033171g2 [Macrostomum lignano]|uniref:Homeobox domain-containing protein n=2 Tax=Macrostomum lignano TaxID=282301 RepID=A0A1I8G321_9PLAT|nr:hypothetical protein BOX15_Mlig033171g2 [Macrostomum lignano]